MTQEYKICCSICCWHNHHYWQMVKWEGKRIKGKGAHKYQESMVFYLVPCPWSVIMMNASIYFALWCGKFLLPTDGQGNSRSWMMDTCSLRKRLWGNKRGGKWGWSDKNRLIATTAQTQNLYQSFHWRLKPFYEGPWRWIWNLEARRPLYKSSRIGKKNVFLQVCCARRPIMDYKRKRLR